MTREERVWQAAGILVALVTMWVPLVISIGQFERSAEAEKHVELDFIGPLNPMSDLSRFPGDSLQLTIEGRSVKNLRAWSMILQNTGRSPITADDFFQNLRISVEAPWELVGVGNSSDAKRDISLKWNRVDERTYEAVPFLFNPGDRLLEPIYATSSQKVEEYADVPEPKVTARIVNLRNFSRKEERPSRASSDYRHAFVYLTEGETYLLLFLASLLLAWYLRQGQRARLPSAGRVGIPLFVGFAVLSYSTAEVVVYYTFGGSPINEIFRDREGWNWQYEIHNLIVLTIHIVVSAALVLRARARLRS